MRTQLNGPQAAPTGPGHPDPNVFVPKFKGTHTDNNGRTYDIRKVPQSNQFEITADGSGDLPRALKGTFTSIRLAEKTVSNYLDSQRKQAAAEAAKVDVFKDAQDKEIEAEIARVNTPEPAKEPAKKTLSLKK